MFSCILQTSNKFATRNRDGTYTLYCHYCMHTLRPASLNVAQSPLLGFSQRILALLFMLPCVGNCSTLHFKNEIDGIKIELQND